MTASGWCMTVLYFQGSFRDRKLVCFCRGIFDVMWGYYKKCCTFCLHWSQESGPQRTTWLHWVPPLAEPLLLGAWAARPCSRKPMWCPCGEVTIFPSDKPYSAYVCAFPVCYSRKWGKCCQLPHFVQVTDLFVCLSIRPSILPSFVFFF